jgi:hypothetical protein
MADDATPSFEGRPLVTGCKRRCNRIRELAVEIPGLDVTRLFADAERSNIRKPAESAEGEAGALRTTSWSRLRSGS